MPANPYRRRDCHCPLPWLLLLWEVEYDDDEELLSSSEGAERLACLACDRSILVASFFLVRMKVSVLLR